MSLRCHSGFVHYNMFHDNHCHGGGDIIGSVFNYTYNCNGDCGGGGFMGGLGFGIGLSLMNLLSGWFNGGGFGGFNYGMPGGYGTGNSNRDYSEYSSSRSRRSTCDCKCGEKTKEVKVTDKDYSKINEFHTRANKLIEEAKTADKTKDFEALINELEGYLKQDDIQDTENVTQINEIIKTLKTVSSKPVEMVEEVEEEDVPEKDYQGRTNYNGTDEVNGDNFLRATDLSGNTRDTKTASGKALPDITKQDDSNVPKTIVIHDAKDITYTFKEKTSDGEYVYTSNQSTHDYILVKTNDGKFELAQYDWHTGYGIKDWSASQ